MSTVVPIGPVALLIDADNLSSPELVAQALQHLTQLAGPVGIRRAYGSAENLKGLAGVLREFAFHLCVNLPLTKNTTDMALAVDAMDLCARYQPGVLAIGTGDADFAPLVLRLREGGVRTVCFAQANKMSPDVHGFYDEVVLLGARRGPAASAAPVAEPAPARKTAARKTPARKTAAKTPAKTTAKTAAAPVPPPAPPPPPPPPAPVPVPAPPPLPPAAPRPARVSAPAAAVAAREAELGQRVQALLREIPGVAEGQAVDFGEVARLLREAKLLGRSAVMSKFLKKHVPGVELTPEAQPRKLRWAPGEG